MELIDSHAHLTDSKLIDDIETILSEAQKASVVHVVSVASDLKALLTGLELVKTFPNISLAAAVHPHEAESQGELFFPLVEKHARVKNLVAIGETGLDYYYRHSSPSKQKDFLKRSLKLAQECHLPVIFHCRDAFFDLFKIADEEYKIEDRLGPAVLHCFTGNQEEAKEVLKRGWYISFSGIITFKKRADLREIAKIVPLNQLLVETDSPYLAPQKFRGKVNQPLYLREIVECIAVTKGISQEEVAKATTNNARHLFALNSSTL